MRRILIALIVMLALGCNRDQSQVSGVATDAPGEQSIKNPSASSIATQFQRDIKACEAVVKLMARDKPFIDDFVDADHRSEHKFVWFLRASPFASRSEYEYIIRNAQYFDIDVSFDGDPLSVAVVDGTGIYCAPTLERLKAVEALGESNEAWGVREFFLDKWLASLYPPGNEMLGWGIDFSELSREITEASRLYKTTERQNFVRWLAKATTAVEKMRNGIVDGSAGLSADQQNADIDKWISFLKTCSRAAPK